MRHRAVPDFWRCYESLPVEIQRAANKAFEILKKDPHHPSLRFKRLDKCWSVRVGLHYRALANEAPGGFVWYWIGSHADYNGLVKRPVNPFS